MVKSTKKSFLNYYFTFNYTSPLLKVKDFIIFFAYFPIKQNNLYIKQNNISFA